MPTYEYKCTACDHRLEAFQSMKDKPLRKCPKCGKNALERLISGGGAVLFKGSGFYQTDYRSESYKKAAKSDSGGSGNGDSGGGKADSGTPAPKKDTKAESKPEKKPANKPAP